jgi:adenosine deaminase
MPALSLQPDAELHVHLRGAMPPAYFAKLLAKRTVAEALAHAPERHLEFFRRNPNIRAFLEAQQPPEALFRFEGFEGFLASYLFSGYFIRDAGDFRGLLSAVRERLADDGIAYAEVTVSIPEYRMHGIPLEALGEALSEEAKREPPRLRWIVDLVRNLGVEAADDLLRQLLAKPPEGWVGITLGGSEHLFPPAPFAGVYGRARAAGLRLTVHAGEAAGPESVWDAIQALRVDRIGHGVRSIEDPRLVAELAERQIPLEVCLTSNVRTGVYPSFDAHPLVQLVEAGVAVTLNTDDPAFFGTSLEHEFTRGAELGLTRAQLDAVAGNARLYAFEACNDESEPWA